MPCFRSSGGGARSGQTAAQLRLVMNEHPEGGREGKVRVRY